MDIRSSRLIFWDLGGQQDLQSLWDKVSCLIKTLHLSVCCYGTQTKMYIHVHVHSIDPSDLKKVEVQIGNCSLLSYCCTTINLKF